MVFDIIYNIKKKYRTDIKKNKIKKFFLFNRIFLKILLVFYYFKMLKNKENFYENKIVKKFNHLIEQKNSFFKKNQKNFVICKIIDKKKILNELFLDISSDFMNGNCLFIIRTKKIVGIKNNYKNQKLLITDETSGNYQKNIKNKYFEIKNIILGSKKMTKFFFFKDSRPIFYLISKKKRILINLKSKYIYNKKKIYLLGTQKKVLIIKDVFVKKKNLKRELKPEKIEKIINFSRLRINRNQSDFNWYKLKIRVSHFILLKYKKLSRSFNFSSKSNNCLLIKKQAQVTNFFQLLNFYNTKKKHLETETGNFDDLVTLRFNKYIIKPKLKNYPCTNDSFVKRQFIFNIQITDFNKNQTIQNSDIIFPELILENIPFRFHKYYLLIKLKSLFFLSIICANKFFFLEKLKGYYTFLFSSFYFLLLVSIDNLSFTRIWNLKTLHFKIIKSWLKKDILLKILFRFKYN